MTSVDRRVPDAGEVGRVMAEVLGVPRVEPDDDFFSLGGDSLHAVRIAQRLSSRMGARVPLATLLTYPTAASLASRLALLAAPEEAAGPRNPPAAAAGAGAVDGALSYAQRRVWILHELRPARADHLIRLSADLHGAVDPARFAASWSAVVARHAALRTRFDGTGTESVSTVDPVASRVASCLDLRALPAAERDGLVAERVESMRRACADLRSGGLLRVLLVRLGDASYRLELVVHHIVCDGWSLSILLRDFLAAYLDGGLPAQNPAAGYGDYVRWEREMAAPSWPRWVAALGERLRPLPDDPRFPGERPGGGSRQDAQRAAEIAVDAAPALAALLAHATRTSRRTTLAVALAALSILVARLTGQEDLLVAVPLAGRGQPEHEDIVGLFVNTGVARMSIVDVQDLAEVLRRAQDEVNLLLESQAVPFDELLRHLNVRRADATAPLARIGLAVQNYDRPHAVPKAAGFSWTFHEVPEQESKFDLGFTLDASADRLRLLVTYRADLFPAPAVEQWAAQYLTVLRLVLDSIPSTR
ncbi:MAG TPA: condensation domain-containing protein [Rugosimonospora sp.]|nr:condensation domain-containing protein [Rugosimonospora sp.]